MKLIKDLGMKDVISKNGSTYRVRLGIYECSLCSSHTEKVIGEIKKGIIKSCGCLRGVNHRLSDHDLYATWTSMRHRCHNPKRNGYQNYGGRGITVCARWRDSFHNFLTDMGERPSRKHSLDRINNNGNYKKSNCKWSSRAEQNNNKSNNILLTAYGITLNMAEWGHVLEIPKGRIRNRIMNYKWSHHDALFTPKNGKRG